jgi:metallophosphoesterase (TIGR03767 family)
VNHFVRTELAGVPPAGRGECLLALAVMSDVQVLDTASPARCEWVAQLEADPLWQPLQPMHRPYEALAHWALAAHVAAVRRKPAGAWGSRRYDLALSLGDNIDNAQHNELDVFLAIMAGGRARLSAYGGAQDPSDELGPGSWPYWCPDAGVPDLLKPRGWPAIADFLQRASSELVSPGVGLPWTSVAGNHDLLRQGTALPDPDIEAIAVGAAKTLRRPDGLAPNDPLARFVTHPADFSRGITRQVAALQARRALSRQEWIAAHIARGAVGYSAHHAHTGVGDTVIETEHVQLILLDTNHPAGDYQGSVGVAQLAWLEERLAEVDRQPGRLAMLASHHGAVSLTNTLGDDPDRKLGAALTAVLHRHRCVAAWLVGHRHLHRITPHPGPSGGFWEIATASLIDWPSQARAVELMRHRDGQLEIVCTLMNHGAPEGSLAHLHHALARRGAGGAALHMQGQPQDGDVRLGLGSRR